jgi:hypothetical protein
MESRVDVVKIRKITGEPLLKFEVSVRIGGLVVHDVRVFQDEELKYWTGLPEGRLGPTVVFSRPLKELVERRILEYLAFHSGNSDVNDNLKFEGREG